MTSDQAKQITEAIENLAFAAARRVANQANDFDNVNLTNARQTLTVLLEQVECASANDASIDGAVLVRPGRRSERTA